MPACTNCGSEVPEGARICAVCNYPQEAQAQEPARPGEETAAVAVPPQPPPQAFPQPQVQPGGAVLAPPTDGQAVAALVLGILGIVACPVICSIIAIVLGRQSQARIEASGGTLGGLGLAKAGWILGVIGLVLVLFWIGLIVLFLGAAFVGGGF